MRRASGRFDDHLVTLSRIPAPEFEDYHTLRYALEEKGLGEALRIVAVTSPVVGDGKTTTTINLAGVLATRREGRILLIDNAFELLRAARVGTLLHEARWGGAST